MNKVFFPLLLLLLAVMSTTSIATPQNPPQIVQKKRYLLSVPKAQPASSPSKAPPASPVPAPTPANSKFDPKVYAKNGVSQDVVNVIKLAFDLFDTDQGGSIDINELKGQVIPAGLGYSKNEAPSKLIAELDADGNGTIDFAEWFSYMIKRIRDKDFYASRDFIDNIFALINIDRTGYISQENLKKLSLQVRDPGDQQNNELYKLIIHADADQDGLISMEEFQSIMTRKVKN